MMKQFFIMQASFISYAAKPVVSTGMDVNGKEVIVFWNVSNWKWMKVLLNPSASTHKNALKKILLTQLYAISGQLNPKMTQL
jgi:hypothetical protein